MAMAAYIIGMKKLPRSLLQEKEKEMTERVVWHIVRQYAKQLGVLKLAPHDLRRSCARLCYSAGGELEQNQAVNDRIGIDPSP
jgi:site-specific recombinase XerD